MSSEEMGRVKEALMSDKEGILQLQPSGRWAVCRHGREPVEITSGELFRVEVNGELKVTRMEFREFLRPLKGRENRGQSGEFYSADGYWLRDGLRAAIGALSTRDLISGACSATILSPCARRVAHVSLTGSTIGLSIRAMGA
jgi:hypothetical protein